MKIVRDDSDRDNNRSNGKKIIMRAVILHPILTACVKGATTSNLVSTISNIMSTYSGLMKKYLFYMIEYHLILYNGKEHLFIISNTGIDLLRQIELMKSSENLDTSQIFLQISQ